MFSILLMINFAIWYVSYVNILYWYSYLFITCLTILILVLIPESYIRSWLFKKGVDTLICFQLLSRLLIFIICFGWTIPPTKPRSPGVIASHTTDSFGEQWNDHETKSNMDVSYPPIKADFGEQCWKIIPFFGTFFSKKNNFFPHQNQRYQRVGPSYRSNEFPSRRGVELGS